MVSTPFCRPRPIAAPEPRPDPAATRDGAITPLKLDRLAIACEPSDCKFSDPRNEDDSDFVKSSVIELRSSPDPVVVVLVLSFDAGGLVCNLSP